MLPPRPGLVAWHLIHKLVAFDTTSRESNLALIDWVRGYLGEHGIPSTLTFNDDQRKANLFATLPAQDGNTVTSGIVLSGHTDVVPVDGQPWETNPFDATIVGDKVYGRGVTDMKSFSATALALVPEFLRRGLRRPVHFALSYDEEVGCIGVRRLIEDIGQRGVLPHGLHRRRADRHAARRRAQGQEELSLPRARPRGALFADTLGVNAVQIACEIVTYLTNMARAFRDNGAFDDDYDVPYTTVHTGMIHGGTALNIVPRDCWFDFEIPPPAVRRSRRAVRRSEGLCRGASCPEMRAVAADTHIEFDAAFGDARFRHPRRQRNRGARQGAATARTTTARSRSAPRRRCSTMPRSRRSSAVPATSRRRTSRTNG